MDLWTQRYGVWWAPTLSFYENRYAILRSFEEQGLLRQFRAEGEDVGARLGDPFHAVVFGENRLTAMALSPEADDTRVLDAARTVLERLAPSRIARVSVGFQWLRSLDLDYDLARKATSARLFGRDAAELSLAGSQATDFALLMDGSHPSATYQFETGVVRSDEIPGRFSRGVGRMQADPETPPSIWEIDALPNVALFADMRWWAKDRPNASPDGVLSAWDAAREAATAVASELFQHLGAE